MKKHLFSAGYILLLCSLIFAACTHNNGVMSQNASLQVRLTDAPGSYDAVNIDIRDVQINVTSDDNNGWQSLPGVHQGVYNLLNLVNDKDTLLVNADIPAGRLQQMRLVLGPNNSVVVDGVTIPLETPSAQQSGLKLNIHQDVTGGILYTLLLDFDAARSIVKTGNNKYILKPVIRTVLQAAGGSVTGVVLPDSVRTAVFAIQGSDTLAGTVTGANGGYLIRGLNAGSYSVAYSPLDTTYQSQLKTGVLVNTGMVTKIDTVRLVKK